MAAARRPSQKVAVRRFLDPLEPPTAQYYARLSAPGKRRLAKFSDPFLNQSFPLAEDGQAVTTSTRTWTRSRIRFGSRFGYANRIEAQPHRFQLRVPPGSAINLTC